MRVACVFVETEMGATETVAGSLQGKAGPMAADVVTSPQDVIALVQGVDADAVTRILVNDVQATECVRHTTTCITLGSSSIST